MGAGRRRSGRSGSLIAALAILAACATPSGAPEGDRASLPGLEGWQRSDRHGLSIYTNAPTATARRAFRRVERFLDAVSRLVSRRPFEPTRRLEVFVFGSSEDYGHFASDAAGHAMRRDDDSVTALSIEQIYEGSGLLYHELTHSVLHNDPMRRFPSWFHEGLAEFFGTSVLRGDVLTIGGLNRDSADVLRAKRPLPLRRLLASPVTAQADVGLFYADAWAFVHFGLLSASFGGPGRLEPFGRFVDRTARGEPWEQAFVGSFGLSPEELAPEVEAHRERLASARVVTVANLTLGPEPEPPVFEPVGRLEIAHRLAQLGVAGGETGLETSAGLLDLILEEVAYDPDAIHLRIRVAARRDEIERGEALWAGLRPEDRRGLEGWQAEAELALARAAGGDDDRRLDEPSPDVGVAIDRYQRVLEEAPGRLSALAGFGRVLVLATYEDPEPGVDALERAVEMSPRSPELRLDLAELLIRSGEADRAGPQLDYVLEAYPGSDFEARARKLGRAARARPGARR